MESETKKKLIEKIHTEQDSFVEYLITLPPREILEHSYEYWVRQSIVERIDAIGIDDITCEMLLNEEKPLEKIYSIYASVENDDSEFIHDMMVYAAGGDPDEEPAKLN